MNIELDHIGSLSQLLLSSVLWSGLVLALAVLFLIVGLWWRDRS